MNFRGTSAIVAVILFQWTIATNSLENSDEIPTEYHKSTDSDTIKYKYEIKKFRVPVDHFSCAINHTFELRYLVNDTWQSEKNPPIFFYTGNEGGIEVFAQNTGFMWDIAAEFKALIVFAEHRYYGESLPYGNKSSSDIKHLGYLNSEQALADYVDLIEYLRSDTNMKLSPVIVFGGSYGGMLSAWFRLKYPHIVQGAIAASAPILQFTGVTDCQAFSRIVTSDFKAANAACPQLIRKSWNVINDLTSTDDGKKWLSSSWKLCKPLTNMTDVKKFKDWLIDIYGNLAMANYPYESSFLAPLPAFPIKHFCNHLTNISLENKELLLALNKAVNVYANYTGKTNCFQTEDAAPDLGVTLWNYQACTEMVMPMCCDGINDMFEPQAWNLEEFKNDCQKRYNVEPKPYLACKTYGCKNLNTATNIVFSNGLLDPWSSGGVLMNLSESARAVIIPEGAHHLDLRGSHPADPYSVVAARNFHRFSITKWIREYRSILRKQLPVQSISYFDVSLSLINRN